MEWKISTEPVPYQDALDFMEARAAAIHEGRAAGCIWLLEHPPLYTAGTSAKEADLLEPRFPVFKTGRGGQYTYHGPGQRIAYVMMDLKKRRSLDCLPCESRDLGNGKEDPRLREESSFKGPDVRRYVCDLEEWIIRALAEFGVKGERRQGRVGIWVATPEGDKKIAAIGVRIKRWVTLHGFSINVNPDLSHFSGIVPCGIRDAGVTSLEELGIRADFDDLDRSLYSSFL